MRKLVALVFVLLTACAEPAGAPATPSTITSTPTTLTPTLSEITVLTIDSNGIELTYHPTTRFLVFLDGERYPPEDFFCEPEGIASGVSNGHGLYDPDLNLYSVGFDAVQPGTCILRNGDFAVTIRVVE